MKKVWDADEDIRSLKSLILFGMRGMAAYAYHALMLGQHDDLVVGGESGEHAGSVHIVDEFPAEL